MEVFRTPGPPDVPGPAPGSLADCVRRAAAGAPERPALLHRDRVLSWAELDAEVDAVAVALRGLDLPPSDGHPGRVAVALPNVPEFASAFFGVLRAGLVAVPVNPGYTGRELAHILGDSGAGAMLASPDVVAAAGAAAPRHTYPIAGPDDLRALPAAPAVAPPAAPASGEDLAVLLYTSGTSGVPKGAMLPHRALIANHVQLSELEIVGPADTLLLALPLFHAYGLNTGLGALAFHGATGVLVEEFTAAGTLELIERHQVSVVLGVPGMFAAWADTAGAGTGLRSVRLAVSGAAPLPAAVAERFTEVTGVPVHVGYGLTETAPVLTTTLAAPAADPTRSGKPGSIGRAIPGVTLRLVDLGSDEDDGYEDEYGAPAIRLETEGPGSPGTDPGEIVVRGANLFLGYWPDRAGGPDAGGWWATGDVAYADEEFDLFLVDRIGELILVSGFNVYPYEVEMVLAAHPGVAEAAVVGVPDPRAGQAVRAYVVPVPGVPVTEADLAAHSTANLARFKCPSSYEFVPELPRSIIGKVRKSLLRDLGHRVTSAGGTATGPTAPRGPGG